MNIRTVYIEITNRCNLNCRTCYNQSGMNCETNEISVVQLEDIINMFVPHGLKRVLISGGEPTLHSDFNGIFKLFDKYTGISFGVVTNGTTESAVLTEYVNTHDNMILQISLDGSTDEVNSRTRSKGHFEKVIQFIDAVRQSKVEKRLKTVVSQKNYDDIEPYFKFAMSCGFIPEYAFIYRSGNGEYDWENISLSDIQRIKAVKLIDKLNLDFGQNAFLPICTNTCPYTRDLKDLSICIKTDGSIQPCQTLYGNKYSVGNVFDFDDSSFQNKLGQIAKIAKLRTQQDYGCKGCLIREYCGRGCMAEAVCLHGDSLADDGNCNFRKTLFIEQRIKGNIKNG